MSSGFDEFWDRKIRGENIPPEFGGPVKGVTGKNYEQLEFDFSDAVEPLATQEQVDLWKLKNDSLNHILQAKAIVDLVNESIGMRVGSDDTHELALWGASELLQKAEKLLES